MQYRSQLSFLTGWVHHLVYIAILEFTIRHAWTHMFCLCACMEVRSISVLNLHISPQSAAPYIHIGVDNSISSSPIGRAIHCGVLCYENHTPRHSLHLLLHSGESSSGCGRLHLAKSHSRIGISTSRYVVSWVYQGLPSSQTCFEVTIDTTSRYRACTNVDFHDVHLSCPDLFDYWNDPAAVPAYQDERQSLGKAWPTPLIPLLSYSFFSASAVSRQGSACALHRRVL